MKVFTTQPLPGIPVGTQGEIVRGTNALYRFDGKFTQGLSYFLKYPDFFRIEYEASDFKVGQFVKCIDSGCTEFLTPNMVYRVERIGDDRVYVTGILDFAYNTSRFVPSTESEYLEQQKKLEPKFPFWFTPPAYSHKQYEIDKFKLEPSILHIRNIDGVGYVLLDKDTALKAFKLMGWL